MRYPNVDIIFAFFLSSASLAIPATTAPDSLVALVVYDGANVSEHVASQTNS